MPKKFVWNHDQRDLREIFIIFVVWIIHLTYLDRANYMHNLTLSSSSFSGEILINKLECLKIFVLEVQVKWSFQTIYWDENFLKNFEFPFIKYQTNSAESVEINREQRVESDSRTLKSKKENRNFLIPFLIPLKHKSS